MAVPSLERREGVVFLLSWHIIVRGGGGVVFWFLLCFLVSLIIGVHWGGLFLYSGGTE